MLIIWHPLITIRQTQINPVSLPQDYRPSDNADIRTQQDKPTNESTETIPQITNLNNTPEFTNLNNSLQLTNLLNSIYKQANEQNENQRTQYEKLTKTLNHSIQAKTNA